MSVAEPPKTTRFVPLQVSFAGRLARVIWRAFCALLFRPTPNFLFPWRRLLLRLFGAKIGRGAHAYPSAIIWAPWNLEMDDDSCLSFDVKCYSVAKIRIGKGATVSQYAHLCTGTHDYTNPAMPLLAGPIDIGPKAWICADAFIGPGVTIGEGAVVGARAVVTRDVDPWTVVAGNPAKFVKKREMRDPVPPSA